jgi:DNA-binding NarL/FixJ family response regulator
MYHPRLLLAEDHAETAELLVGLLQPEFDVVAQVPDVIVSDISMPGLDGIEAATMILGKNAAARIILVTVHCDPLMVERGLAAGVLGCVLKCMSGDELVTAVHAALRGERHISRLPSSDK